MISHVSPLDYATFPLCDIPHSTVSGSINRHRQNPVKYLQLCTSILEPGFVMCQIHLHHIVSPGGALESNTIEFHNNSSIAGFVSGPSTSRREPIFTGLLQLVVQYAYCMSPENLTKSWNYQNRKWVTKLIYYVGLKYFLE